MILLRLQTRKDNLTGDDRLDNLDGTDSQSVTPDISVIKSPPGVQSLVTPGSSDGSMVRGLLRTLSSE